MEDTANSRLCYSIAECAAALGLSVCLTRELVRQKKTPSIRLSERRILIPVSSLQKIISETAAKQTEGANGNDQAK